MKKNEWFLLKVPNENPFWKSLLKINLEKPSWKIPLKKENSVKMKKDKLREKPSWENTN